MRVCLKYARLFWVIAIFFVAAEQIIHVYEDFLCSKAHASEHQATDTEQQDCPTDHTCCHSHSQTLLTLTEAPAFLYISQISCSFSDRDESAVEGPVRKIDHPPQLS